MRPDTVARPARARVCPKEGSQAKPYKPTLSQPGPMAIKIYICGGTFDKEYNELSGELFFKESHLPEVLRLGRSAVPVEIRTLMMVDSISITDEDRELIVHTCTKACGDRVLITHGTDTMVRTATLLAQRVKDKTIVLTGAMIPYTFGSSDGLFNLGSALAFAQVLPVPVGRSIRGRAAKIGGCLIMGCVALAVVAVLLRLDELSSAALVVGLLSGVSGVAAVITYIWCWPTAVRDFDERSV